MRIFVFGNPDLENDSIPLRLLPKLKTEHPDISFEVLDPNEDWDVPEHMVILDTVVGIEKITIFPDLDAFARSPRVTCHDFDAYTNLRLLKKLGKIETIRIIGLPANILEEDVLQRLSEGVRLVLGKKEIPLLSD